jgi:hypothetical protein
MSSYIKSTDFSSKDSLLIGNPLKVVSGTELDDEFNNIQTSVNTKSDSNSPTFTGVPLAPTANSAVSNTQLATTAYTSTAVTAKGVALTSAYQAADSSLLSGVNSSLAFKATIASPTFTGVPLAPTASGGNSTTQLATTAFVTTAISSSVVNVLNSAYPVGSIYTNAAVATNPTTLLGFGTWVAFGSGRVLVGFNGSDTLFNVVQKEGGVKDAVLVSHSHTATSTVTDSGHTHNVNGTSAGNQQDNRNGSQSTKLGIATSTTSAFTGVTVATSLSTVGVSGTNANVQPYITVYMWRRTA